MHMAIEYSVVRCIWLNPICTCQAVVPAEMLRRRRRQQHMCKRSNDIADNWDAPCNWANRKHNQDDNTLECEHMAHTAKQGGHLTFNIFSHLFASSYKIMPNLRVRFAYTTAFTVACVKYVTLPVPSLCFSNNQLMAPAIGINFIAGPAVSAFWIQQLCDRRCYPTKSPFSVQRHNGHRHRHKMQAAAAWLNKSHTHTKRKYKERKRQKKIKINRNVKKGWNRNRQMISWGFLWVTCLFGRNEQKKTEKKWNFQSLEGRAIFR